MNEDQEVEFETPNKIERTLAFLSDRYGEQDKQELKKILVNSSYRIDLGITYDRWDGGIRGHEIYFSLPTTLYNEVFDSIDEASSEICDDINKILGKGKEYIAKVILTLKEDYDLEWRENSSSLLTPVPVSIQNSKEKLSRIWQNPSFLRLFISHKVTIKTKAKELRDALDYFGVSCFVAHEDIEPTLEWQQEIENALFSMDVILVLLTPDFKDSDWTGQEVGVAIGRQVPIISVRLGMDPFGFFGKYQALPYSTTQPMKDLAQSIYDLLWSIPILKPRLVDSLVSRFETSKGFCQSDALMNYLEKIDYASPEIIDRLSNAKESNRQVKEAFGVQKRLPALLRRLRANHSVRGD